VHCRFIGKDASVIARSRSINPIDPVVIDITVENLQPATGSLYLLDSAKNLVQEKRKLLFCAEGVFCLLPGLRQTGRVASADATQKNSY
jgi:hypothetical protein